MSQAATGHMGLQGTLGDVCLNIRKRDGRIVQFDADKITEAIYKAARAVGGEDRSVAEALTVKVLETLRRDTTQAVPDVEKIQDTVEKVLIEEGHARTAKAYILYRDRRTRVREGRSDLMDTVSDILVETHRENANIGNSPSAKMLQIASAASRQYYLHRIIPEDLSLAHRRGDMHIHDLDFYGKTLTCIQIPLGKLLSEGFDTGHGFIRPPRRIGSAAALSAIILQSSQNDMHGGQSFSFFDRDMAPFAAGAGEDEIYQAMEALVYNLNSMHSRAGAQVPFSSINFGTDTSEEGRRVTRALLLAYERGLGRGESPIFPNLIYRLQTGVNFNPGDPNYDLFRLAIRVAARRLNPTFSFMDSSFNAGFGSEVAYMGCRTRVIANKNGPAVSEGRGNLSFTTINLPRVALKSRGSVEDFYRNLEDVMDTAIKQLYHRYTIQSKLRVADMPFLMGQHLYLDSEKLGMDDYIEPVMRHGTLSMGFIGMAETLTALTGTHHGESRDARRLGMEIIKFMRGTIDAAVQDYNLNYTLLATPAEGLSGRFVGMDVEEYGLIPGVTDKEYYSNSFHVPVGYDMPIDEKLETEGRYHSYCNAGHISYVELDSPPVHNLEAVESIVRQMAASDMGYAGINFPVDECRGCAFSGIIADECPACGSSDIRRVRRITGYLSTTDRFNDGKRAELRDRANHKI